MTKLRPLIAANWKMNGDRALAENFSTVFSTDQLNDIDVVLCPPSIYLESLITRVAAKGSVIKVGAQNVSEQAKGAFTGELSTTMLLDLGCDYVIVGHSERRSLYGESPELVANKYRAALQAGLRPILCTGESEQQREQEKTFEVIAQDLDAVIAQSSIKAFNNGIVAYEPVWAIGTGKSATPAQAQEVHQFIRQHLAKHDEEVAAGVRILYGGSVNENNAAELFKQHDINGALVGGASLIAEKFMAICQNAQRNN